MGSIVQFVVLFLLGGTLLLAYIMVDFWTELDELGPALLEAPWMIPVLLLVGWAGLTGD